MSEINLEYNRLQNDRSTATYYRGLDARKPVFGGGGANGTGADQPAHPRSLISAFVIHALESTISKLATSEISFF